MNISRGRGGGRAPSQRPGGRSETPRGAAGSTGGAPPVCPGSFQWLLMEARCSQPPLCCFFFGGGGPPGAVTTPGTPSPLPSPCPGLCQPAATSPLGSRSGFLFSFFPRSEQLIIYPVIKEETVNEMKTSQKHLLGRLSSPAPGRLRRKRWREGDGGCRGGHGGSRRLSPTPGLPHHGPLLLLLL